MALLVLCIRQKFEQDRLSWKASPHDPIWPFAIDAPYGVRVVAVLLSAVLLPTYAPAQSLAEKLVRSPSYPVTYTDTMLANGLRVLVVERRLSPLIAADLFVQVGQRDDLPQRLGIAHLVEHVTDRPDLTEYRRRGGWQFPAYTSYPATVYSGTAPATALEAALYAISEVLRQLQLDERNDIGPHRQQVLSEVANPPRRAHAVADRCQWELYYLGVEHCRSTPDVAGAVNAVTPAELERFWRAGYLPNNSILVIVGEVDTDAAIAHVARLFGDLKPAKRASRPEPSPMRRIPPRRFAVEDSLASATRLLLTYRTAGISAPDYPAVLVLQELLGGGESALLNQRLVGESLPLTQLEINGIGFTGYGVPAPLFIQADLRQFVSAETAERAIAGELHRVTRGEFTEADLVRAKNRLAREFVVESRGRGVRGLVYHLGSLATAGQPELINGWLEKLDAVTVKDISAAAAKYLATPPRFTVISSPAVRKPLPSTRNTP